MAGKRKDNDKITINNINMKKLKSLQEWAEYTSPRIGLIEVETAQVLCGSGDEQISGALTGASWETGEDAEW